MSEAPVMEKLGYQFIDAKLLKLALTHKSSANENFRRSNNSQTPFVQTHNERLEFLGDSVLGLVVTDLLYENSPDADEGTLSKVRSLLVRAETLSTLARNIGLGSELQLGRGELSTGGGGKESILSSTYEAVLGAVYLDGGLEAAYKVVSGHMGPLIESAIKGDLAKDFKTNLQEIAQRRFRLNPSYRVAGESGPDHDKTFSVIVKVGEQEESGTGRNKKEAEQSAARALLDKITDKTTDKITAEQHDN